MSVIASGEFDRSNAPAGTYIEREIGAWISAGMAKDGLSVVPIFARQMAADCCANAAPISWAVNQGMDILFERDLFTLLVRALIPESCHCGRSAHQEVEA